MTGNSEESKKFKGSHAVDRLSGLSDSILHYILSFLLDTKSVVRTSLLARRWRGLWKHVHVLDFVQKSFPNPSSFEKHINGVLSNRFHQIPVSSITFNICGDEWGGAMKTFEKIMKYADSHVGVGGGVHHLSFIDDKLQFTITEVADVITASHHNESLKTLVFRRCTLEREFDLHFKLLTTLELYKCRLQPYPAGELFDPFANLPCLNQLKLFACLGIHRGTRFIISGLQLLVLEIQFSGSINEVCAPKLKYLYWQGSMSLLLPKLNLPALDHANIRLGWHMTFRNAALQEENRQFMRFLHCLKNAERLQLCFEKAKHTYSGAEQHFPLDAMKVLIGHEAPPFTRLKTLRIQCAGQEKLPNIHYEVIRYFFEGSLSTEAKHLQLELVKMPR